MVRKIKYKPMVYKSTDDFKILSKGQLLDRKFAIISRYGDYPAAYVSMKEIEKTISTHYEVDYDIDVHGGAIRVHIGINQTMIIIFGGIIVIMAIFAEVIFTIKTMRRNGLPRK